MGPLETCRAAINKTPHDIVVKERLIPQPVLMQMLFLIASLYLGSIALAHHPLGRARNGSYYGVSNERYGVEYFLGIPFAQPPDGDLRLRLPQSLNTSWHGARNATEYGYACVGYGDDTVIAADNQVSEDCLTLNIIRPAGITDCSKLPVLVWIYGGGFFAGASRDQRYNLTFIVEHSVRIGKPIMAVSMNYRLAGYGFLYSEDIVKEGLANLGLRDQRLALHWIQENIAGFGGDPSSVTIWGESAGAISVGYHLRAFDGRDDRLFHRAIADSGAPVGLGVGGLHAAAAKEVYHNVTTAVECNKSRDQLQCLRAVSTQKLTDAINASLSIPEGGPLAYSPLVDGDFVTRSGVRQLEDGAFVKVPYIIGDNTDEGTSFSPFSINTEEELRKYLSTYQFSKKDLSMLLNLYPSGSPDLILQGLEPWNATIGAEWSRISTIIGDLMFILTRHVSTQAWAKNTDTPLYVYRFNATPNGVPDVWSATHFMEAPWFFHNTEGAGFLNISPPWLGPNPFDNLPDAAFALADTIGTMLVSFVHTGNPNKFSRSSTKWPRFEADSQKRIVFTNNFTTLVELDNIRAKQRDWIECLPLKELVPLPNSVGTGIVRASLGGPFHDALVNVAFIHLLTSLVLLDPVISRFTGTPSSRGPDNNKTQEGLHVRPA
ncbi:hypothetical protein NM208_g5305 [Fusarium decemcellulare]|uniref:Uncharacterized protein n=1 Tax=Fusarium decemcellulare TaxID=57161 RepID=A0ACC1SHC2_9HYPO|nr:hypothetical protein NM208_g5305 [Fusarium decemcellulare]